MKYLDQKKTWKYYAKSSAVTFFSVFLPLLALEVAQLDISSLKAENVTLDFLASGVVMVARLVVIALLKAAYELVGRLKK